MNKKNLSIITTIKQEGFISYFLNHFSTIMNDFPQKLLDITNDKDLYRWIDEKKFQMGDNEILEVDDRFLSLFINRYCQPIHFHNVAKFINITKDDCKHFWIIDKTNQNIYFRFRNLYGEGSMKRTYLGWNITKNKLIVVYQINISSDTIEQKRCLNEKRIAEIEKSPYLLTIHYSTLQRDRRKIYMIADFYTYDVKQMILNNKHWSMKDLKTFSKHILKGLHVLHSMNIVHRDVKPSNILFDDEKDIYLLADFGIATKLTLGSPLNKIETLNIYSKDSNLSLVGTAGYISPEMYTVMYSMNKKQYDNRVDIFSFGITLLEMFLGQRAFIEDLQDLSEEIENDSSLIESEFPQLLMESLNFLQKFITSQKSLQNEIQEKINIIHQLFETNEETDMLLDELMDKNKTIIHLCQKNQYLQPLKNKTVFEYEYIYRMQFFQNYKQKKNKYMNTNTDDLINDVQLYLFIFMTTNYRFPKSLCRIEDPVFRDFITKCIEKDPSARSNISTLLEHEWIY